MTQALQVVQGSGALARDGGFNREQIDLLKQTVAKGTSDNEFALFVEVCKATGLNPFQRQIYAVMRKSGGQQQMTIQTGIDGYRLIAARSGVHAGTSDAEYGPEKDGYPEWAKVTVKKLMPGGMVADFTATARWSEYAQKNYSGQLTGQWPKMPFLMLAKCAEALALRKAFPAELSGVYTNEEMAQADNYAPAEPAPVSSIKREQTTAKASEPATEKQVTLIAIEMKRVGWSNEEGRGYLAKAYGKQSRKELTKDEASEMIEFLKSLEPAQAVEVEAEVVEDSFDKAMREATPIEETP